MIDDREVTWEVKMEEKTRNDIEMDILPASSISSLPKVSDWNLAGVQLLLDQERKLRDSLPDFQLASGQYAF